ncbi:MAG: SMC-Scp complex subunit ScpB [Oleispira sp.]|nr:SMC-Scp complex subunit ScpB [Oleispira sp.]
MELNKLKQIIEAVLMASGEVLSIERLQLLFDDYDQPKSPQIKQALESLMEDFSGRGIELVEVASGYRLQVRKDVAPWVTRLWDEKPQRYSRALLETMSLIAYRQPITRGDIEDVRGVAVSSNIIRTLLEREWIRVVGHRDVPGRPSLYATTKEFLDYFSLKSLDELPSLDEIRDIDEAHQNLDLINAEKKASATREYDFVSEDDVTARGEEILAETELELEEAERLIQQVEDNVFNKPSEEELAAEREAERQAKAGEERLAEEASAEKRLADKFAQPSLAEMANKTQQRLSPDSASSDGPSTVDLADKIAHHQARLAGINTDVADVTDTLDESLEQQPEGLTLLQQQEQLMRQLMQEESQRQQDPEIIANAEVEVSTESDFSDKFAQAYDTEVNSEEASGEQVVEEDLELEAEQEAEAELLAEAEAEKELLEQEALEQELLEKERVEKERLAEETLENELGLESNSDENGSNTKKNSLFDD